MCPPLPQDVITLLGITDTVAQNLATLVAVLVSQLSVCCVCVSDAHANEYFRPSLQDVITLLGITNTVAQSLSLVILAGCLPRVCVRCSS